MHTAPAPLLTPAQLASYRNEGWCLLPACLPAEQLALLRAICDDNVRRIDAELAASGRETDGRLNRRGSRWFIGNPSHSDPRIRAVTHGPLLSGIAQALLGDEVHTFWEQYVVKAAETGCRFAWHQDSAYVDHDHPPYLTCWVALDDMSEANGTASILPFSRAPSRGRLPHRQDPELNDLVGYEGTDPGDLVNCPAGSIAFFSSLTLHRSGMNTSPALRRVYLIQYSGAVIRSPDGKPCGQSDPVVLGGRPVGP